MPDGGFGNLIALPLQHEARSRGCTVFVDDELNPYPDQWAKLSRQETLSPVRVGEIVGNGPGTEVGEPGDELALPWEQSLTVGTGMISGCPESITLTLALSLIHI